jgi:hypothetical protein
VDERDEVVGLKKASIGLVLAINIRGQSNAVQASAMHVLPNPTQFSTIA